MKIRKLIEELKKLGQEEEIFVANHTWQDETGDVMDTQYHEVGDIEVWDHGDGTKHWTLFPGTMISG
jgi:hypothetical protein